MVEMVKRRVVAKIDRGVGDEETLVVIRTRDEDGAVKHDYYLSNAAVTTPEGEFARVAKAEHRIEECLQRGKSEAGLADYQVRTWNGWHHHITLSLMATWFLVLESQRGKKVDAGITVPQIRKRLAQHIRRACRCDTPARITRECQRWLDRIELARLYHHKARNRLPQRRFHQRR